MEIDRKTIKALSAERRIDILKSLRERRKMPAELSKELDLAASTINEHLNVLESAGLVRRKETGHKWIYYELTSKGESLIKPQIPIQVVLILSLGLVFIISGALNITTIYYETRAAESISKTTIIQPETTSAGTTITPPNETETIEVREINYVGLIVLILGIALVLGGGLDILNKRI